jgi:hypothetical protein
MGISTAGKREIGLDRAVELLAGTLQVAFGRQLEAGVQVLVGGGDEPSDPVFGRGDGGLWRLRYRGPAVPASGAEQYGEQYPQPTEWLFHAQILPSRQMRTSTDLKNDGSTGLRGPI